MSAHRFVNTADGTCWTRREETRNGEALYAPEKCGSCPAFVMVTLTELAELGIVGSADVLPVPVDPGPVVRPIALAEAQIDALAAAGNRVVNDAVHEDLCMCDGWPESCVSTGNYSMGDWDMGGLEAALPAVLGLWESMRGGEVAALQARVAELEADLATANGTLDDVAKARRAESCPCPPENPPTPHQVGCFFDGVPVSPPSERPVNGVSPLFPTVASLREASSREEPHDSPLHRDYKGPGHDLDLPATGGA